MLNTGIDCRGRMWVICRLVWQASRSRGMERVELWHAWLASYFLFGFDEPEVPNWLRVMARTNLTHQNCVHQGLGGERSIDIHTGPRAGRPWIPRDREWYRKGYCGVEICEE